MNKIKHLFIAGFFGCILLSCNGQTSNKTLTDPIEFAKEFTAVCNVGIKGGDGTLIATNWVLTAGHVAQGMYKRTNGNLSVYFENGTEYKVKNVFLHPRFEPLGLYDIALLEIEDKVTDIVPIKINKDRNEINKMIFLVGHGDKKQVDGTWIKDGKLRGYTNIIDEVNETHLIFDYDSPENNPTEREGTSGPGDSGGPALLKEGENYYVAGVSSMGEPGIDGPASFGAIEHFVRVSNFQDWILETIKNPNEENAYSIQVTVSAATTGTTGTTKLSDSEQSKRAMLIIESLENYTEEKMINAIKEAYDASILQKRSASEIIKNMPALIRELQNARLIEVISESPTKISIQMKKGSNVYGLDIFFLESSQKIEQMAFGKFN